MAKTKRIPTHYRQRGTPEERRRMPHRRRLLHLAISLEIYLEDHGDWLSVIQYKELDYDALLCYVNKLLVLKREFTPDQRIQYGDEDHWHDPDWR